MHPLDVKISLSNEINVIRIECVKQKKSIFQFVSPAVLSWPPHNSAVHRPSPLALGNSRLSPPSARLPASPPFSGGKKELWFGERGLS